MLNSLFTETEMLQTKHVGLPKWLIWKSTCLPIFRWKLGTQHQIFYVLSTLSCC